MERPNKRNIDGEYPTTDEQGRFIVLNHDYEKIYPGYTEKAKKLPAYNNVIFKIESGDKATIDDGINYLEDYTNTLVMNEQDSETSLTSRFDAIRIAQEQEKNNFKYSENLISLVRSTLEYYCDLILGVPPKEPLVPPKFKN